MTRDPLTLDQLLAVIDDARAAGDLARYFEPAAAVPRFAGGRFELLAGGGDRKTAANRIVADDLIAVELLSVQVPAHVALDLLDGELGVLVASELAGIPTDVSIGDGDALHLLAGPAAAIWHLLRELDGMGWVTAGKLIARKRPRLVPVYDHIVRCAYGHPSSAWRWLHERFGEDGGAVARHLEIVRRAAELPDRVSALRVLDVILWMRHRHEHQHRSCPGLALNA